MSILKVARMGHPVLRERARRVDPSEILASSFQKLIDDMLETLDAYDGIGLAAPQVHESVRLVLVGINEGRRREEDQDEGDVERGEAEEGRIAVGVATIHLGSRSLARDRRGLGRCLSLPGLRGRVSVDEVTLAASTARPSHRDACAGIRTRAQRRPDPLGVLFVDHGFARNGLPRKMPKCWTRD
jgi:peptide deformylase